MSAAGLEPAVAPVVPKLEDRSSRGLLAMEEACFGSREPKRIWRLLCEFVDAALEARLPGVSHYSVSIGAVVGIDLAGGEHMAIKVFAPWHGPTFLHAASRLPQSLLDNSARDQDIG